MNAYAPTKGKRDPKGFSDQRMARFLSLDDSCDAVIKTAYMNAPYVSIVLDHSGRVIMCNRRAIQTLWPDMDISATECPVANIWDITTGNRDTVMRDIRQAVALGTVDLEMRRVNAQSRPAMMRFRTGLLRSGRPGEFVILLTQDHLQKTAEAFSRLRETNEEARRKITAMAEQTASLSRSLETMETFTHAASHDLKAPLGNLNTLLNIFAKRYRDDLPEAGQKYIDVMSRAAQKLQDLTSCLLDYARASSGKLDLSHVDLRRCLEGVRETFGPDLDACGGRFDIEGSAAPLMAAPWLLDTLLFNLVGNAIKYRSNARPLRLIAHIHSEDGHPLSLTLSDNGQGFEPDMAARIMRPFERLATGSDGSGIGLATCAEICRRHNWQLNADALPEVGATFTIFFNP